MVPVSNVCYEKYGFLGACYSHMVSLVLVWGVSLLFRDEEKMGHLVFDTGETTKIYSFPLSKICVFFVRWKRVVLCGTGHEIVRVGLHFAQSYHVVMRFVIFPLARIVVDI